MAALSALRNRNNHKLREGFEDFLARCVEKSDGKNEIDKIFVLESLEKLDVKMDPREKDKTLDFDSNACFVMEGKIIKDDHCFVTNHTQKKVQHCRPVPQVLVGCSG